MSILEPVVRRTTNHEGGAMKFLLLLRDDPDAVAAMTPEQRGAIVDEHIAYSQMLRERGAYVIGEALDGSAATVRPGGSPLVTDGPFAETKEEVGGFYLIECPSRAEAIELAKQVPRSPGLTVEVLTVADV
jgi:hypothetical protein